jgi:Ca2+-binding EF-hand superfamily protein
MSTSTASASTSAVTLSRAAIALLAVTFAGYGIYRVYKENGPSPRPNTTGRGLRRSNAIHRRRRRLREAAMEDHDANREFYEYTTDEDELPETIAPPLADGETVIGDNLYDDDEQPQERSGRNHMQLLFQVSENETRRNAYVHRGLTCNYCGDLIRGIRYRCTNCIDFDLCEICEDQQRHTKTHIFVKIRVPLSYYASKEVQPVSYPGNPDRPQEPFPKDLLLRLSRETGFEGPEVQAFWEQFQFTANTEWLQDPDGLNLAMDRHTFDQCLIPSNPGRYAPPNLLHDRMFAFYDTNRDELISFPEYLHGLAYRKKKDKLKKVFEGYDIDEDGFVDRKDFLRLFRCYYVLYKDLQRDMLEGIQDQVLHSLDGVKLVSGRQPLSSAFGHDGNFSPRVNPRAGQGKRVVHGEDVILDDKGITLEDWNELGNREDVFRLVPSNGWTGPNTIFDSNPMNTETYWENTLSPPSTIEELNHDVLERLIENRIRHQSQQAEQANNRANGAEETEEDYEDVPDEDWPPPFVDAVDILNVTGGLMNVQRVPREKRAAIIIAAQERIKKAEEEVRGEIYERWKRRGFYTDEEEGGVPPVDWNDEDDVATHIGSSSEPMKHEAHPAHPISPRSRSSSKVRFVEDTDAFETRSNPSTSSRSVAERWGGMDIPEAEKDAGKEILYQVAQQAFNELLDPIFKKAEDRAMSAMASRELVAEKRHLLSIPAFVVWAGEVDKCIETLNSGFSTKPADEIREWRQRPQIPEVELSDVRQRPLNELLDATGYSVSGSLTNDANAESHMQNTTSSETQTNHVDPEHFRATETTHANSHQGRQRLYSISTAGSDETSGFYPVFDNESSNRFNATSQHRDPTLPQFRPDNTPDQSPSESAAEPTHPSNSPLTLTIRIDAETRRRRPEFQVLRDESVHASGSSSSFSSPAAEEDVSEETTAPQLTTSEEDIILPEPEETHANNTEEGVMLSDAMRSPRRWPAVSDPSRNPRELFLDTKASIRAEENKRILQVKENLSKLRQSSMEEIDEEFRDEMQNADWMVLYKLREDEMCTDEANYRKGWGRLDWEEFERTVKECEDIMAAKGLNGRGRGRSLDYLGSWIEFCIP